MARVQLRIQSLSPREPWWPDEDALGKRLADLVRSANAKGQAPTMGVVARRDRVQLVPLRPLAKAGLNLPMVLAALSRWDEGEGIPEAVGLLGRVRFRRAAETWSPLALVFLEWPDGRWWEWRGVLDGDGVLIADAQAVSRAVDGLARPSGLGGWWTMGRRRKPVLRLERSTPPMASEIVQ